MVTNNVDIGKRIDGVLYRWLGAFGNKRDALTYCSEARKKGKRARIRKSSRGWDVYLRDW